jgi:hypothetical protein
MTPAEYRTRCRMAESCLPPAEYRTLLTQLHDDMLDEIEVAHAVGIRQEQALMDNEALLRQALKALEEKDMSTRHINEPAFPVYTSTQSQNPIEPSQCKWKQHDDINMPDTWGSDCGVLWTFTEDGPTENGMKYCHKCGKPLIEVKNDVNKE